MAKYRVTINPRNQWDDDAREAKVSPRGLEVLVLVADGMSNRDTARALDINYQTVKTHLHNVVKKIGANNVTQAFMLALAKGLIRVTTDMPEASEKWRGYISVSGKDITEDENKIGT